MQRYILGGIVFFIASCVINWPSHLDGAFVVPGQTGLSGGGQGGAPVLESFSPTSAPVNSPAVSISVQGRNFTTQSRVFGNVELVTTYISSTELSAVIPADSLRSPGSIGLRVVSPAGNSGTRYFTVVPPASVLSLLPSSGRRGAKFIAQLSGDNLQFISAVSMTGSGVTATLLPRATSSSYIAFIEINVDADAAFGLRSLLITSSGLTAAAGDLFTVRSDVSAGGRPGPPLPMSHIEDGAVRTGYAVITDDNLGAAPVVTATIGTVRNGAVTSQSALVPLYPGYTMAAAPVDQAGEIGRNFGMAVVNGSASGNEISVTLLHPDGSVAAHSAKLTLGTYQQVSRYLSELFPANSLQGFARGAVIVHGSRPFAVVGMKFVGSNFSPVPFWMSHNSPDYGPRFENVLPPGHARSAGLVLPQFVLGAGWATQISLANVSGIAMNGEIAFYSPDGNPQDVNMNGETKSVFRFSVSPGGTFVLAPRDVHGQTAF